MDRRSAALAIRRRPRFSLRQLLLSLSLFSLMFACFARLNADDYGILWVLAGCWALGAATGALRGRMLRGGALGLLGFVLGFVLLISM